jgi:hypothetical protein
MNIRYKNKNQKKAIPKNKIILQENPNLKENRILLKIFHLEKA